MVLREMVRLAESRRTEMLESLERVNKYNVALIAFAAGFLSLIVTASFEVLTVQTAGGLLILCIICSLVAVRPKNLPHVSLTIEDDVKHLQTGQHFLLSEYLLLVAELTDVAASNLNSRASEKKILTIISASFLALSLLVTYTFHAYA